MTHKPKRNQLAVGLRSPTDEVRPLCQAVMRHPGTPGQTSLHDRYPGDLVQLDLAAKAKAL